MPDDPRLNLPSASSFELDCICAGRQAILQRLTEAQRNPPPDDDAEFGLAIHKAREKRDPSELDAEQREVYDRGLVTEQKIVEKWTNDFGISIPLELKTESRLWFNHPDTLQPITSAQLDVHYMNDPEDGSASKTLLLVIDWKTMFCTTLTPAEKNWQGRIQAVVADEEYNADHVRVVFNKAMFGTYDAVDYTRKDLDLAKQSVLYRVWETRNPDANRVPGVHCRRCAAARAAICPEAGAYSLLPSVIASDAKEMVAQLKIEDCVKLWNKSKTIRDILDAATDRLKTLSESELTALGLKKGKPKNLDPITDTRGAWHFLTNKLSSSALWDAISIGKTDLAKAIAKELNMSEAKAKAWLAENLKPFITKKESERSIEKLK